ncbi:MAG: insulinase family protein [Proteobacteria bacterium]|jgi:predicted Zn-dependent peptidase|nr:pitrilysin family protein [Alphaproteobacteria bacterium]NCC02719.1 insulinase family protein [Pseudomonadota bacterium]
MTVQISTLPNGLRIATDTMAEAESVAIGAWVGVGTRHEPWNANGIAHLTEHMMFKGTKHRSAYTLSKVIEKNGGVMNAHTTREETAYYARVLPEDTERAMDVVADMLMRSVFDEKELNRERQVIIQEIGSDLDTPEEHIYDLMHENAFPRQKIGRSILGTTDVIEKLPREMVIDYVNKYYHAGNIVIVGTGKINHDELVKLSKRFFGRLPAGRPAKADCARIRYGDRRQEKESEQLHLLMAFPAPGLHTKKSHVANLLGTLLGGSSSSRLFQKVREKRGLVYNISTYHLPFQDVGLFCLYAGTDPQRAKELIPVVCKELRDVTHKISPSELKRAKAQLRADLLMSKESVMRRAEMLGSQILNFDRPIEMESTLQQIMCVTEEDTQAMAKKILSRAPIFTALGPVEGIESYRTIAERLH